MYLPWNRSAELILVLRGAPCHMLTLGATQEILTKAALISVWCVKGCFNVSFYHHFVFKPLVLYSSLPHE